MNLSRFIISYINYPPAKGIVAINLDLFWVISNIIRNTLEDFMWKCNWEFVGEKCEHFFRLNVCIGFRVSSTFGHFRRVSDKSQTMSGLPGVPNDAASQTI